MNNHDRLMGDPEDFNYSQVGSGPCFHQREDPFVDGGVSSPESPKWRNQSGIQVLDSRKWYLGARIGKGF